MTEHETAKIFKGVMTRLRAAGWLMLFVIGVSVLVMELLSFLLGVDDFKPHGLLISSGLMGLIFGGIIWAILTPPMRHEPLPGIFGRMESIIRSIGPGLTVGVLNYVLIMTMKPVHVADFLFIFGLCVVIAFGGWGLAVNRSKWLTNREMDATRLSLAIRLRASTVHLVRCLAIETGPEHSDFHVLGDTDYHLCCVINQNGAWPEAFRSQTKDWSLDARAVDQRTYFLLEAIRLLLVDHPYNLPLVEEAVKNLINAVDSTEPGNSIHVH